MKVLPDWSLPKVTVSDRLPGSQTTRVVFLHSPKSGKKKKTSPVALDGSQVSEDLSHLAAYKTVQLWRHFPQNQTHTLWVGLGSQAWDVDSDILRQAMAVAVKTARKERVTSLALSLEFLASVSNPEPLIAALLEGFWLATYDFRPFAKKSEGDENGNPPRWPDLTLVVSQTLKKEAQKVVEQTRILVEGIFQARYWGDLPGNLLTPEVWAKSVQEWFKGIKGVQVEVWDKKRIEKEGMGGLLAVNRGSVLEPRFIKVEYRGRSGSSWDAALVGKGLTFDSGGISLKPANNMEEMKYDMCGGANVLATTWVAARLGLPVNLLCFVPATENLPSGSAQKPGDVYVSRKGLTVEVQNTDAEGRLILGEALHLASEAKPQAIVELSTLTGAILVALGNIHAGLFTQHEGLAQALLEAARRTGEKIWRMPLVAEHREDMKGTFTDLVNISQNKGAGSATAAGFLQAFVDEEIPFAHFDIAGTAWAVGNRLAYCPSKGASGVLIRLLVDWLKQKHLVAS